MCILFQGSSSFLCSFLLPSIDLLSLILWSQTIYQNLKRWLQFVQMIFLIKLVTINKTIYWLQTYTTFKILNSNTLYLIHCSSLASPSHLLSDITELQQHLLYVTIFDTICHLSWNTLCPVIHRLILFLGCSSFYFFSSFSCFSMLLLKLYSNQNWHINADVI